jgi:hypothetical protein
MMTADEIKSFEEEPTTEVIDMPTMIEVRHAQTVSSVEEAPAIYVADLWARCAGATWGESVEVCGENRTVNGRRAVRGHGSDGGRA